jgi:ABC-type transporter Mla subunit MlaD
MTTTLAGVTAAVCTALLLNGCTALDTPGRAENHITADFRSTAGIFDGNPVAVLGLQIGTVDTIIPHEEYNEVHMSINASV